MKREPVAKFYCVTCGHDTASRVLDTRGPRRRRECLECGATFPTIEKLAPRSKTYIRSVSSKQRPFDFELT